MSVFSGETAKTLNRQHDTQMPKLIVNADDFGLSVSVNRGIIEAHRSGIVTSTTLLANGPGFEDGLNYLSDNPRLGVGVHLNILRGRPVSDARYLSNITERGLFSRRLWSLVIKSSKNVIKEIEIEYRFQIEKVLKHTARVTHLDSEKHHHCIPSLFNLTVKLAAEYKIPAVRLGNERWVYTKNMLKLPFMLILNAFAASNRKKLRIRHLKSTENQIGINITGSMELGAVLSFLDKLPSGTTEFCTHPGYSDAAHTRETAEFGGFYIDRTREKELDILTHRSVKELIRQKNIKLIHYGDL